MTEFIVSITQRAFSSISEHVLFVRNVSLEAAKDLYEETVASLRSLPSFPERCPEIQDLRIAGARIEKCRFTTDDTLPYIKSMAIRWSFMMLSIPEKAAL